MSRHNYYSTNSMNMQQRIQQPHPHDILSGRGGGINSHVGNIQFRSWVAERKNDYNLAASKVDKAEVAQEVIALVEAQDPPGRFLHKDPSAGGGSMNTGWVELDAERRMAKTAQALREGAPQIRALHKDQIEANKNRRRRYKKSKPSSSKNAAADAPNKRYFAPAASSMISANSSNSSMSPSQQRLHHHGPSSSYQQQLAMQQLQANVEQARRVKDGSNSDDIMAPEKRARLDYRGYSQRPQQDSSVLEPLPVSSSSIMQEDDPQWPPTLDLSNLPEPASFTKTNSSPPRRKSSNSSKNDLPRTHSLQLSDESFDWATEDFVNPFENESSFDKSAGGGGSGGGGGGGDSSEGERRTPPPPRPGVTRDGSQQQEQPRRSSSNDLGGLSALYRSNSSSRSRSSQSQSQQHSQDKRPESSDSHQAGTHHMRRRSSSFNWSKFDLDPASGFESTGSLNKNHHVGWDWGSDTVPVSP